jgi:hypothetical protein
VSQKRFSYATAFSVASGYHIKGVTPGEVEELVNFITSSAQVDDGSLEALRKRAGAEVRRQQPELAKVVGEFWASTLSQERALREMVSANNSMLTLMSPDGK